MSAATAPAFEPGPLADSAYIRVALREIRDVAYRALRVAGDSPGAAELAAGAVVRAEVQAADGLALLLDELPRVCSRRVPARLLPGPVAVLDDTARRGLFFAVPAAVETCLATQPPRRVLVPGASWRPAIASLVAACAGPASSRVRVVQLDPRLRVVAGDPDGLSSTSGTPTDLPADLPAGLLVHACAATGQPAANSTRAWAAAQRYGVLVDADAWAAAAAAARGYLVPEA